jgi:3-phytase
MKPTLHVLLPLVLIITIGCNRRLPVTRTVPATIETTPVQSTEDAADDPAVFVHPTDPSKSVVIGTDKQNGLVIYNLDGSELHRYAIGRINNVDLRSGFDLNGEMTTIVVGSNRTNNTLSVLVLDHETRELRDAAARPVQSNLEEVYGCCMYQNPDGKTYAFLVGKSGMLEQWELFPQAGKVGAKLVRNFDVGGQCEGMVADDELGYLYVGEEDKGIWKFGAEPDAGETRQLIDSPKENRYLKDDIEGLAIYYANSGKGYLLVSSQGNNSYAVYRREGAWVCPDNYRDEY